MTLIKRIPKGDPLTFQIPPAAQTTTLPVIYKERSINQVLSGQIHPRGDQ